MKIYILTTRHHPNSRSFVYPFLVNRQLLKERGIKVKIIYSCDISPYRAWIDTKLGEWTGKTYLFVDSKFFRDWWENKKDDLYRFINEIGEEFFGKVYWFDTTDSTGTPQFKVMLYMKGYFKNQILKDKTLYFNKYHGNRLISDYFKIKESVKSPALEKPLDPKYMDKLKVSWNPALVNHGLFSYYNLGRYIRPRRYIMRFTPVNKKRKVDISARVGMNHKKEFVRFHRELMCKKLLKFNIDTRHINYFKYFRELQNSKISISPFGLGEITYRDFDSILAGACLVKPDLGHMETWPDLFKPWETYVPCKWDFSDLKETLDNLLSHPLQIRYIARNAQNEYRYYFSKAGRIEFCDRIEEIIK